MPRSIDAAALALALLACISSAAAWTYSAISANPHAKPHSSVRCSHSTCLRAIPPFRYGIEVQEAAAEAAAAAAARLEVEPDYTDLESAVFEVEHAESGDRIDKFLAGRLPEQSRTYYGSLCAEGCVIVDGTKVKKSHKVVPSQSVEVRFAPTAELYLTPQNIPLDILYEDAEMIAIAKPPGMVVHPAPGNWDGTFVNALLYHLQQSGTQLDLQAVAKGASTADAARPGVVHRLDKGTSGVLLAAKNPVMQAKLSQLFQDRAISKTYIAVCAGNPGTDAVIDVPIGRHATNRQKMVAVAPGDLQPGVRTRRAVSYADTAAFDGRLSVVQVRIETGRTHQIRVHMQQRRTPVIGDELYGNREWNRKLQARYGITRPLLHAYSLEFKHPNTGKSLRIEAPLPADIAQIVRQIYPQVDAERPQWVAQRSTVTHGDTHTGSSSSSSSNDVGASNTALSQDADTDTILPGVAEGMDWFE